MNIFGINSKYLLSDNIWQKIVPLLPKKTKKRGRPRMDDYQAMCAIFYLIKTGCQWKALPSTLGASSTVHDRFQEWTKIGLFSSLWQKGVIQYNDKKGILWKWQSMDGCIVQAPMGGNHVGPSYKHRGKSGTNRSLLTDARGIPLALVIDRANRNDMKLTARTLKSFVVPRPSPISNEQHICLDKGYDYPEVDEIIDKWGYTAHIKRRGQNYDEKEKIPKYKARRWVVERTHAWMNDFRRLIIRWEKKSENYLSFLHLSCALISFRST